MEQLPKNIDWSNDRRFQKAIVHQFPAGTIREWHDGKKHQKQSDGSWKEMGENKIKEENNNNFVNSLTNEQIETINKLKRFNADSVNNPKELWLREDHLSQLHNKEVWVIRRLLPSNEVISRHVVINSDGVMAKLEDKKTSNGLFDADNAQEVKSRFQSEIKAAFINVSVSTLSGPDKSSIMMTLSLDDKSTWENNILQNSRYMNFRIERDGTVEQFQRSFRIKDKFIKRKAKSVEDAIAKINVYLDKIRTQGVTD